MCFATKTVENLLCHQKWWFSISVWRCFLQLLAVYNTNLLLHKNWANPFHPRCVLRKQRAILFFTCRCFFCRNLPRFSLDSPAHFIRHFNQNPEHSVSYGGESPDRSVPFNLSFWQSLMGVHLLSPVQLCAIWRMVMVRSPQSDIDEQMVSTFRQKERFISEVKGHAKFFLCWVYLPLMSNSPFGVKQCWVEETCTKPFFVLVGLVMFSIGWILTSINGCGRFGPRFSYSGRFGSRTDSGTCPLLYEVVPFTDIRIYTGHGASEEVQMKFWHPLPPDRHLPKLKVKPPPHQSSRPALRLVSRRADSPT